MTPIESGVIIGIPTGAITGGVICRSHGVLGVIGGSLAGMVSGAVAGWLYALLMLFFLSTIGVLWRAARKRADVAPSEADIELMTPIGTRGVFAGVLIAFVCGFTFGWLHALVAAIAIGAATALIAVGRCELR